MVPRIHVLDYSFISDDEYTDILINKLPDFDF